MMKMTLAAAVLLAGLLSGCSSHDDIVCPAGSVKDNDQCHVTAVPQKETTGKTSTVVPSTDTGTTEVTTTSVAPSTSEITTTATVPAS